MFYHNTPFLHVDNNIKEIEFGLIILICKLIYFSNCYHMILIYWLETTTTTNISRGIIENQKA